MILIISLELSNKDIGAFRDHFFSGLETSDYVKNKEIGKLQNISDIQRLDKERRNTILKKAKEIEGISIL